MGEEEIDTKEEDFLLLGILESQGSQLWMIDVKIDGTPTRFKIDTGADVTVLPYDYFKQHLARPLKATKKFYEALTRAIWRQLKNSHAS